MKRFVTGVIFILLTSAAAAEEKDMIDLGEIVVTTPYRTEVALSNVSQSTEVMASEDIEECAAANQAAALVYLQGIDVVTNHGFSDSSSYSIQGSDARQVRVMIDGITLNTQGSEAVPLERTSLMHASSVEVIGGAGSAVWGSGLGGIVNVISKEPAKGSPVEGAFSTFFAENRGRKEIFEMSGSQGDAGYYMAADFISSGTDENRDDKDEVHSFNKLQYRLSEVSSLTAVYGADTGSVNSGIYPDNTIEETDYRQRYGKLGYAYDGDGFAFSLEGKSTRYHSSYDAYLSPDDVDPYTGSIYKAQHYQLSAAAEYYLREADVLMTGLDLDWETVKSYTSLNNGLGFKYQAPYLSYLLREGAWDIHMSLRWDHSDCYRARWNPSLGVVYRLEDPFDTRLRFNAARAYNYPRIIWTKLSTAPVSAPWTNLDNDDLKPETARVYEAGWSQRFFDKLTYDFSLYRSDVKNYITIERDLTVYTMQYINKEKYRREGTLLKIDYDLTSQWSLSAAGAFHRIEDRTIHKRIREPGKPRQSFDLGLHYKGRTGFNVSLLGNYDRWNADSSSGYGSNDRKFLFDIFSSKSFDWLTLYFNIYNISDSKYWLDSYKPYPGRYFEAGLSVKW